MPRRFPIARVRELYERYERRISSWSLLSGFVFDSLTLNRIDNPRENIWIAFNLLLVAVCIAVLNRQENEGVNKESGARLHFWLTTILQFGFGALLGAFFIFYFRSATLASAWPFLLILLGAMVSNELFQKRYARLTFQISFFYLSLFSFSIFLVPVLLHRIGPDIFLLSGSVSLVVLWIFIVILKIFARENLLKSKDVLAKSVAGIFIGMNILYFTNLIPPIPLSLKDAGIYHSIGRTSGGGYRMTEEDYGWLQYFHLRERFHLSLGGTAYAYSAIFSPSSLNTSIVHEWQYKDESTDKWVTSSKIPLSVSGGRTEGFRTFSSKAGLQPGLWRVNVETPRGQLIGRINFKVISSPERPAIRAVIK